MERSPARDVTGSTSASPAHAASADAVPPDLAEALERYGDGLGDYCRMWMGDVPAAVVAETVRAALLLVRDRREPSRGQGRARLYGAARACCLIRLTRPVEGAASAAGAPPRTRESDAAAPILAGLQALDRRQRDVLELACRHGLDLAEIAAVTGLAGERADASLTEAQDVYEAWVNVVMLTRASRAKCAEGSELAAAWSARPGRSARTRLRVHITGCAACSAPASLTVDAATLLGRIPFTPLTDEQRALVLDPSLPAPARLEWGSGGFPVQPDRERPAASPLPHAPMLSAGLEANRTTDFWDTDTPDVPIDDSSPASGGRAASRDDASPRRDAFWQGDGLRPGGGSGRPGGRRRGDDPLPGESHHGGEVPQRGDGVQGRDAHARTDAVPSGEVPRDGVRRDGVRRDGVRGDEVRRDEVHRGGAFARDDDALPSGDAFRADDRRSPFASARRASASPWSGRLGRGGNLPGDLDGFEELGPRTSPPQNDDADDSLPGFGTFQNRHPRRPRRYDDDPVLVSPVQDPDDYPDAKRRRSGKALAATAGVVLIGGLAWTVFGPSDRAGTLDVANEVPSSAGPEVPPTPIPAPPKSSPSAAAPYGGAPSGSASGETPLDATGTAGPGSGVEITPDATPTDTGYGAPAGPGGTPDDGAASGSLRTPDAGGGSGSGGSDSGGAGGGATAGTTRTPDPAPTRTPDSGAGGSGSGAGSGAGSGTGGSGAGAAPKPDGVASATPGEAGRGNPDALPTVIPETRPSSGAKASPSGPPVPSHRPSPTATRNRPASPTASPRATGHRAGAAPARLIVTEGAAGDRRSEIILLRAVNGTVAWRAATSTPLLQLSSSRGVVGPNRRDGFQIRLTPLNTLAAQGRRTINHLNANCGRTRTAVLRIAWTGVNRAGVRTQDVIPLRVTFNRPCP